MSRFRLWLAQLLCGPALRDLQTQVDILTEERVSDRANIWNVAETLASLAGEVNELRDRSPSASQPTEPRIRRATGWREFKALASRPQEKAS